MTAAPSRRRHYAADSFLGESFKWGDLFISSSWLYI